MYPYIMFFSYGCPKSKQIADMLDKHPFQDSIKKFCIDGLPLLPNYIRYTPTLQMNHPQGTNYLIGDQIIEWLDKMLSENEKMANKLDQDNSIGSIDTAFGHQNDLKPEEGNLDDMFKIESGFTGDTQRQGLSEGKMDTYSMDERMQQMQRERDELNNIFQSPQRT